MKAIIFLIITVMTLSFSDLYSSPLEKKIFNDTTRPVITHIPISIASTYRWPDTVKCSVTHPQGIDSVWVRWKTKYTFSGWKVFNLSHGSGDNWKGAFNYHPIYAGDSVYYRIIARSASPEHTMDSTILYCFPISIQYIKNIGEGTVPSDFPFTTYWMDGRTQYLYYHNEIGLNWGWAIQKIAFYFVSVDTAVMHDFTIKMYNTNINSITGFIESSNWNTVYYSPSFNIPGTGWQTIQMTNPIAYSGNNLLIEICYNNSSYTNNSIIYSSSTSGDYWGRRGDLSTASGCGYIAWTSIVSPPGKANIKLFIDVVMSVNPESGMLPNTYSLSQNYPNPFNPMTKISFAIPKAGFVSLKVYDLLGREVSNLINEEKQAGNYSIDFNSGNLTSGVYFYKMQSGSFTETKKMLLIK